MSLFSKKSQRFLKNKQILFQNLFFFFSSRMVELIFSADAKTASIIIFLIRKSGEIGCFFEKKEGSKRVGLGHNLDVPTCR